MSMRVLVQIDVVSNEFAVEWMRDFEAFERALEDAGKSHEPTYSETLTRSMSLVLSEFYEHLAVR